MINIAKAGRFSILVGMPSPIWCRLMVDGEEVAIPSFTHKELTDLIYAAQKALEMARQQLPQAEFEREMRP